jgi:imidazolonepropionase-like amidohydrolase
VITVAQARLAGTAASLLVALVALTTAVGGQGAGTAAPLAITGATLIDGTGAAPAPNQTVLIEGARITAVGPSDTVRVPANARIVNAAGKFVVPGFIDSRVYWRGWTGELFLNHGITSIVDASSSTDWILAARDAERGGSIRGPRILTAAGAVDRHTAEPSTQATVRALLVKGPDFINVAGTLTLDELRVVTREAHAVDVPVLADMGDAAAVDAGVDGIAHLSGLSQTSIARMIERGTYLIPMLVADHGPTAPQRRRFELANYDLLMRPELRYVPLPSMLASLTFWRTPAAVKGGGYQNAKEFVRRFAAAGGRIVAGTDAGGSASVPGLSLHEELELLVDAGLTPMQALVAATRIAAQLVKKDNRIGTVAAGKLADLVILDADPLADIANTRTISGVVKNGQVVETGYHRDYHTPFGEVDGGGVPSAAHAVPIVTEVISVTLNQMSQVIHDGSPFELVVRGDHFDNSSLVELNGRPLMTTFASRTELRARVPTERIPTEGTYTVTVFTPWPGGGRSNVKPLPVK